MTNANNFTYQDKWKPENDWCDDIQPVEDAIVEDKPIQDDRVKDEHAQDDHVKDEPEPVKDEPVKDEPVKDEHKPLQDEPLQNKHLQGEHVGRVRPSCKECVLKHISTAAVYMQEAKNGYPVHKWLAIGELVHAEYESDDSVLAMKLREARKQYYENDEYDVLAILKMCLEILPPDRPIQDENHQQLNPSSIMIDIIRNISPAPRLW